MAQDCQYWHNPASNEDVKLTDQRILNASIWPSAKRYPSASPSTEKNKNLPWSLLPIYHQPSTRSSRLKDNLHRSARVPYSWLLLLSAISRSLFRRHLKLPSGLWVSCCKFPRCSGSHHQSNSHQVLKRPVLKTWVNYHWWWYAWPNEEHQTQPHFL